MVKTIWQRGMERCGKTLQRRFQPNRRVCLHPPVVSQHMEKQVQFRADRDAFAELPPKLWVAEKGEFLAPEVFREINAEVPVLRPGDEAARCLKAVIEKALEKVKIELPVVAGFGKGVVAIKQAKVQHPTFQKSSVRRAQGERVADVEAERGWGDACWGAFIPDGGRGVRVSFAKRKDFK